MLVISVNVESITGNAIADSVAELVLVAGAGTGAIVELTLVVLSNRNFVLFCFICSKTCTHSIASSIDARTARIQNVASTISILSEVCTIDQGNFATAMKSAS